jgi:hypothetical protein
VPTRTSDSKRVLVVGHCRLCGNKRELRDSHFIPQAAYKLVRGNGKDLHPLVVQPDKVVQTSAQTRAHVLCHDCEQRLCKNGENAFFRYCYRGPGKFRLLYRLRSQNPLLEHEGFAVCAVPESERSVIEQIGYMGVSILWKSATHDWKDRDHTIPSISLGAAYQDQFRLFLLEAGPFPECAALIVEVSDENNRLISVVGTPATFKWPTHHHHWIDVCGLRFNLLVGARMPQRLRQLSIFTPGRKVVLVAKQQEATMASEYRELLTVLARSGQER